MNDELLEATDPLLTDAWKRFADYDLNAKTQQKSFNHLQFWILFLGGTATLLALLYTQLVDISSIIKEGKGITLELIFRWAVILTPVSISILMTASNIFKPGSKWLPLRKGAEDIKSEIYRYRTLSQLPPVEGAEGQPEDGVTWKEKLRNKLSQVGKEVMETDVSKAALREYTKKLPPPMYGASKDDGGFSPLTPEQYLLFRLGDQLNYYQGKTEEMAWKMKLCQWLIIILGGIGTFLAAIGIELWVPLTTTLVGSFTTFLEYRQLESNLMIYNQTKYSLLEIKTWWVELDDTKKQQAANIVQLLNSTEKILQSEMSRWVDNMKTALESLRGKREDEKKELEAKITEKGKALKAEREKSDKQEDEGGDG
ncbi:MAG: DUF4231 domain-containing protein [bacterium]|nr:DUF4231 domain-containing protein [bacterium]